MLTSRHASRGRVRRGFVAHADGALHFRWAGAGAPLAALHESPRSSLSLLPLVDRLAERRTVVAFDTPGYGHSDALPLEVPEGEHFAAAFAAALDALGLARAPLYATHTGAALAVHLALARPQVVPALLLDGFAAFTPSERQDFVERYLAPFEPSWDGAHLAQLWSRCKDLYTWFPYHRREPATRLVFDPPPVAKLHDTALGFLMAGAGYTKSYRCAATIDPDAALAALRVPTTITARPDDLICSHLERVTPTDFVQVRRIGPALEDWLRIVDESIANAWRHSNGDRVTVAVRRLQHRLELTIADNGRGGARESALGMGLTNMRQRANSLPGAEFSIDSPDGGGTLVRLQFNLEVQ